MFINEYTEITGWDSKGQDEKIMYLIKATNVLEYEKYDCYIHFDAEVKFTNELKIKDMIVRIQDIELKQVKSSSSVSNVSLKDLTVSFIVLYSKFKKFMGELKQLISDIEYLNSIE